MSEFEVTGTSRINREVVLGNCYPVRFECTCGSKWSSASVGIGDEDDRRFIYDLENLREFARLLTAFVAAIDAEIAKEPQR